MISSILMAASYPSAHLSILINALGSTYLANIWTPSSTTKFHPKSGGWNSKLYGNDAIILLPRHGHWQWQIDRWAKQTDKKMWWSWPHLSFFHLLLLKVWVSKGQVAVVLGCPAQPQRFAGWQSAKIPQLPWRCTEGTTWQWTDTF